ncbi:MAG: sigma-70 family RNA polymerase sigma factor [Bacteroidia bacterium]|nr:sigma-70 family RNA polymerase sigma factor [Bacteroidia bacterium]NNC86799.1 sigma-70 family RNA polymerase sigma factor [Bacteroidia bacterium]NNM16433.1 sigma-70 family RNA polymerase sigma factor [Bacteroidia bacterium]
MADIEDIDLIKQFKEGDNKNYAFNLIVRKYQQRLYFHIRRMVTDHDDANDVLQNMLIKAYKGLNNFREDSQLYTWLYRIATNESLTFIKKKKKRNQLSLDDMTTELSQNLSEDHHYDGDEIQKKLHLAIESLPEKQKAVFNLRYYEEMKYDEMSEVLETSVGALKASYHHAVKKIEAFLKED